MPATLTRCEPGRQGQDRRAEPATPTTRLLRELVVTANQFADTEGWGTGDPRQGEPGRLGRESPQPVPPRASTWSPSRPPSCADVIPVAEEDVCANTVWYVAGGAGIEQTPYFFQTSEEPGPRPGAATGYATGLAMKAVGTTKGGFVTGPELDFSTTTFKAWTAGIEPAAIEARTRSPPTPVTSTTPRSVRRRPRRSWPKASASSTRTWVVQPMPSPMRPSPRASCR